MCFKYPPWIATLTLPFGLFPFENAKIIWALIQFVSLIGIARILIAYGLSYLGVFFAIFWSYGLLVVHFMDSQVTLPMLFVVLWAFRRGAPDVALVALTTKIFSLFGGLGLVPIRWKKFGTALVTLAILSVPVIWVHSYKNGSFLGPIEGLRDSFSGWIENARSAGDLFEGEKIRGRDNQGLPALVLRLLRVPASDTRADNWAFVLLALGLGFYWWRRSLKMQPFGRWLGWLALIPVVHPLAWFHSFVFAIPLMAWVTHYLWTGEERPSRILVYRWLMGIFGVAVITRKTFGVVGEGIELLSIKSWGVLILMDLAVVLAKWRKLEAPEGGVGLRVVV
jgi:hypothetical protein